MGLILKLIPHENKSDMQSTLPHRDILANNHLYSMNLLAWVIISMIYFIEGYVLFFLHGYMHESNNCKSQHQLS
jgi:hypothetical protein